MIASGLGLLSCAIASVLLYIGCPNQQWLKTRYYSFKTACVLGGTLWGLGIFLFSHLFSIAPAIFSAITLAMLFLSTLPLFTRYEKPQTALKGSKSTLSRDDTYLSASPQWWLKSIGAVLLGLPLGLLTSAIVTFGFFNHTPLDVKTQFLMWWITPMWFVLIATIYFSHRPVRLFTVILSIICVEYFAVQVLI
ncbi:hypothetical protein D210916BOD24_26620 [Alteromonas sp. D210916BOD_24]|uniref:hypothetical protein n=1 Tax=Alteromonas sp. D210916BOD_24 TaxID=3157618 RepID=UPI00399CC260